jgi:ketosteroid isomerase-like protein
MSHEAQVRAMLDQRNRGDYDAVLEHYLPDAEWVTSEGFLFEGTLRGRAEIRRFWDDYRDRFTDDVWAAEELTERADRVLCSVRYRARGRDSGVPLEGVLHGVVTFRDDKIARVEMFGTRAEAEVAAGV